jgi:P-type conjugative transfer protein TrbJ
MTRSRKHLVFAAVAALLLVPAGIATADIVFDPTNFVETVEQVVQDVQMVEQLSQQIQNQLAMLKSWGYSQLSGILQSMDVWQQVFGQAGNTYSSTDPGNALGSQYPFDPSSYAGVSDAGIQSMRSGWDQEERNVLIENRTVQNEAYLSLEPTAQRIGQYVDRSNGASGATSATQAGNEELASLVAQLQTLQAQEITDARGEVERDAQQQAEEAYGDQQRQAVRTGWESPQPPSSSLVNAFPLANP